MYLLNENKCSKHVLDTSYPILKWIMLHGHQKRTSFQERGHAFLFYVGSYTFYGRVELIETLILFMVGLHHGPWSQIM